MSAYPKSSVALGALVLAVSLLGELTGASAAPFAYVGGSASVSVVDTATNMVTAQVSPTGPVQAVAAAPDGKRVYAANSTSVSIIDTSTNAVMSTVPVVSSSQPEYVSGLVVSPDGRRVYVAVAQLFFAGSGGRMAVIDADTGTVTTAVQFNGPTGGIGVSPDGGHVYVAISPGLTVIDTSTYTVTATVNPGVSGLSSLGVAVGPDGSRVYVTHPFGGLFSTNLVSVIDTATNEVVAMVPVGKEPRGVAVTPDGKKVYVTNSSSGSVSVIDAATTTVTTSVPVEQGPKAVAVTPDGQQAYVANVGAGTVSVIATATDVVTDTVPVGSLPGSIAIGPPDTLFVALSFNKRSFVAGDVFQLSVVFANPGPVAPMDIYLGVVLPPAVGTTYGCPGGDAALFRVDGFTGTLVTCLSAPQTFVPLYGSEPMSVAPVTLVPNFLSFVWTSDIPAGTYTFFLALTPPGAFADGQIDPADLIALAFDSVTFGP